MMAQIQQEDKLNLGAKKFSMWIFVFVSFMLFAAFSSGFIVYSGGKGHGLNVQMPQAFLYSTLVIMLSSVTMFIASRSAKQLKFGKQQLYLWITVFLGMAFFALQIYACYVLTYKMQIYFTDPNASRSFVFVFCGIHLLHVFAGLLVLINALIATYRNIPQVKNIFKMEMASIFWHFLDIIWIYLYVFLLLNQN
ncbi:cytochrome c oxidase subunit 3 [Mucilaginibacter xinganensis]|uniref:Heme-copper oxidase subunit III n=1 Tax=Mucilaginibacter xinganensis TaxID=1234841 RepID=A0A223NTH0_9SPHI|nr:cytochrome c oxidase subunit 3 [Mucilaginibacter xinganensis]ASU32801.1 heme-copper oxidase subunit III [Mucilaginibacter xinganensis]